MRGKGRKVLLAVLIVLAIGSKAFAQSGSLREYTGYQVMNIATCDSCTAHLLVDYYDASGVRLLTRSETIPPGGSTNIQQKTDDSALNSGIFSTVLMSDQPIAAVMGQVESDPNVATAVYSAPFSDYTGVSFGSTKVTLPSLMKNWYGLDSRIRLQNVGNGTATATIQYHAGTLGGQPTGASTIPPVTRTIPVHASITVDQSTKAGLEATSGPYQGRFLRICYCHLRPAAGKCGRSDRPD